MSDIPVRFGGGSFYQETARGRMNRTSKRNLKAIGYDKWSQSIIVEDPETKEKYPIKINLMNEDDVVNILSIMGTAVGTHINKNDSNLKIRAKKIYSQILSKTLPAMKATGDIQSKLGLAENGGNINVPKNILTRLSRDEFKAMIDHEVQHSHQERMAKRGSGEAVDMAGYQLPGGKITRSIGSAVQRKMGLVSNKLNIGLNATTDWIKDYVNSPAGKKLNTAHDKYLFELEADAAAVRKNGAAVYTRALMHLYGMQASMLRESTINTAKTVAAQNLDKNIKALNDLKTYLHLHDGTIDDATLTKYMNMSGSAVDKISSAAQQIVKQIRQIKSYAAANGIPIKFGTMKEIMTNLNSVEQVVNSFQNPYTTLSANRKEKLLQMDPSKRIQYVDTVYQRCLDARKKSVNIDKQLAKLDKILAKTKNEYEARCEFCRAIEKAAPWTKAAVAEFVAMIPELFGIVFSEDYTMEDLADDILMNDAIYEMFNWYEDSFEEMVVEYALDDSDDDNLFEDMVVEYALDDSEMIEEYCEYEECDWFVQLGDSLFYVSEYHNALFDDPDAHDEAINEFGILLDSYDDGIFQEVASYGPYDEYLKKHGYDPKTNTILDPKRPGKRVSAGRIGSEQERRRMNKFLIENEYDPKTETIQTDIDINVPIYMKATGNQKRDSNGNALDDKGNPIVRSTSSQKKRVKFMINPHEGAYATRKDGVHAINMTPRSMQQKAVQSNQTFKHEEGHINQYTNNNTPTKQSDVQRMNASTSYVSSLDKNRVKNDHDLSPDEYDADAYGAQHNAHDKKGTASKSRLMSIAAQHKKTVSKFEKTLDSTAKKQGIREGTLEYQQKQIVDFLLKHPDHPGTAASNLEWAQYLQKTYSNPEIFKTYLQAENKRAELNDLKKKRRAEIREFAAKNGTDNDAYSDLCDKWTVERKSYENEIEKLVATPGYSKAEDIIEDIIDLADLSPDQLKSRGQELVDKGVEYNKSMLRHEKAYRDPEEMAYAHQKRGEFAQQQWNEQQKRQQAEQAKKRQLSKEQLKQQIASGKLTKDQLAKAKRKLQRIEQFEKSQRK